MKNQKLRKRISVVLLCAFLFCFGYYLRVCNIVPWSLYCMKEPNPSRRPAWKIDNMEIEFLVDPYVFYTSREDELALFEDVCLIYLQDYERDKADKNRKLTKSVSCFVPRQGTKTFCNFDYQSGSSSSDLIWYQLPQNDPTQSSFLYMDKNNDGKWEVAVEKCEGTRTRVYEVIHEEVQDEK